LTGYRLLSSLALCCSLVGLAAVVPASAATIEVTMTGSWQKVVDTAGVLDGSIVVGGAFEATFSYDDQTPDSEPTLGLGDYLMNGSAGTLRFVTGSYAFVDRGTQLNGVNLEDGVQGFDLVALFFDAYAASGPLPAGVELAPLAYANPTFLDSGATALASDRLTDVPWDAARWDGNFYFFAPVTGRGALDHVELDGAITGLSARVLPEPGAPGFLTAAVLALLLGRRVRS
jgi:hypothetical protein